MADETVVLTEESNSIISANYKTLDSNSSTPIKNGEHIELASLNQGSYEFIGQKYRDDMCLYQVRNDRTWDTGKMCVRQKEFLAAEEVVGDFGANGVVGLAPVRDNFIDELYYQGVIRNRVVGLNLENPLDTDQKSRISIGQIDYNEVEGGVDGLNYYSNRAVGKWGLQMDDFLYDDVDMTSLSGAKIGLIDSGNTTI